MMDTLEREPNVLRPESGDDLREVIGKAAATGTRLRLRGGGSKDGVGASAADASIIDMRGFSGIVDYAPSELVLTAGAGTPLSHIMSALASEGQALAFDPFDHGPLFGKPAGTATLGGIVAANVSGPRRLSRGAARDHVLGFSAVSGRGERFIAGGKVVKNVTGYDLPKLIAGSWGRLAALTEVTLKVLPSPRTSAILRVHGLAPPAAVAVMARAMGSSAEVCAARHIPAHFPGTPHGAAVTELLLEGFPESVDARLASLSALLRDEGEGAAVECLCGEAGRGWDALDLLASTPEGASVWRISVRPSKAAQVVVRLEQGGASWTMDCAGGLIWAVVADHSQNIREISESAGGNAMLMRGPQSLRQSVAAMRVLSPAVAALEQRVRRAFDPAGVFETGRF